MAELKAAMDKAQLERIRDEAAELKASQENAESSEILDCLPHITIADVPLSVPAFPSIVTAGETTLLAHPVFSNGILAADLAFDASDLSEEEILLLPFFCPFVK